VVRIGKRTPLPPDPRLAADEGRDARPGGQLLPSCPPDPTAATIVVVHESLAVLELIEQALRELGHCVLTTNNALEALDVVGQVTVDLLLLEAPDCVTARDLARDFRTIQPQVRVVYLIAKPLSLSGLTADVAQRVGRLPCARRSRGRC